MSGDPVPPVDAQTAIIRSVDANDETATMEELRSTISRHEARLGVLIDFANGARARTKLAILHKLEQKKRECAGRFDGSVGDAAITVLEEMKQAITAMLDEEKP